VLRCAGHSRRSATRASVRPSLFDVLPVILAGALLLAGGAGAHTLAGNKRAARRDAEVLLDRLRLPAGAVRAAKPALSWPTTDQVEADASWRVPRSAAEVAQFIKRHPPRRGHIPRIRLTLQNGEWVHQAAIQWPMIGGVIYDRYLVVTLTPLPDGTTNVRASSSVYWVVPRSAVSRPLARAGALTVSRGSSRLLTTSRPAKVRRIRAMFDNLRIIQPGVVISCYGPDQPRAWITFRFYAYQGGPGLARAIVPPVASSPCGPTAAFAVPAEETAFLFTPPSFLRKAGSVLGVRLAS
jgi:hypothetical protein